MCCLLSAYGWLVKSHVCIQCTSSNHLAIWSNRQLVKSVTCMSPCSTGQIMWISSIDFQEMFDEFPISIRIPMCGAYVLIFLTISPSTSVHSCWNFEAQQPEWFIAKKAGTGTKLKQRDGRGWSYPLKTLVGWSLAFTLLPWTDIFAIQLFFALYQRQDWPCLVVVIAFVFA